MTKPYHEDDLEGDEGVKTSGLGRVVTVGRVVTLVSPNLERT